MPGPFEYTQGSFWGGPWYPYWTLMIITVIGGFLGFDHLWLRSPTTAFLKIIFNILTLGMWYIYDILQVFGEKEKVMKYGLSIPVYGAAGIGSGAFRDGAPEGATLSKSPFRYLLYMFAIWLPLGLDMVIQGDLNGGMMKLASLFIIFLWPIAGIWYALTLGRAYFSPTGLFTQGSHRFFPWTWIGAAEGPSSLGPKEIDPTGGTSSGGFFGVLKYAIQSAIGVLAPPLLPAEAAVGAAVQAAAGAVSAGAKTAQVAVEAVGEIIEAAKGPAAGAVGLAAGAADMISQVPPQVLGQLRGKISPEAISAALQKGGGLEIEATNSPLVNTVLTLGIAAVAIGGSVAAYRRLNGASTWFSRTGNDGRERNDAPPKPSSL
jgi:hypothetical protein